MNFLNLGVKKKLFIVFLVIFIFIGLIGTEGMLGSVKINNGSDDIYSCLLYKSKSQLDLSK
jgi:methyl-accepting chemotaxis protein